MKKLRQEFADTMLEIGVQNSKLVVLVGDISHGILQPFAQSCPGRYFNIGICEPSIVGIGSGMAKVGLIPVIHTITPFMIERAYEQIKLDFGYQNLGGNFISVGSAFDYSQLGCSHHCYGDISMMSQFKNSHVFFPGSPIEFNTLFKSVYQNGQINYFRLPEKPHGIELLPEQIELGKAIQIRKGKDLTLVVIGPQLKTVLKAVPLLKEEGVDVEILYYPTLKPFDGQSLQESAQKTGRVLVVEETFLNGGIYLSVLRSIRSIPNVACEQIAIEDFIHIYGSYEELCEELGFSVKGIIKTVREKFQRTAH